MKKQTVIFFVVACFQVVAFSQTNKKADLLIESANKKIELRDFQGVIQDCTKIVNLKNINGYMYKAPAYLLRGVSKFGLEDYEGAIVDLTNSIILSFNENAFYWRGMAKDKLKDYYGAIADYTSAININANNSDAYDSRGLSKGKLKDYDGAIGDFSKAIELNPNKASAYRNRGSTYLFAFSQKKAALADYMKVIELGGRIPQELLDDCK